MSEVFWLGVAQTSIGSAFGFGLGIVAFHYQQRRQAAKGQEEDWKSALDAINRLIVAAGANIESLANTKLQIINNLATEVSSMKAAVEAYHDAAEAEKPRKLEALRAISREVRHFYMTVPRTSIMPPPDVRDYSSLSKDMPALTMFVHRAVGMMQDLNEIADLRNSLIAEQAREGASGSITVGRFIYFVDMLASQGEGICMYADFSLDFWRLVREQVRHYTSVKAKGLPILDYRLVPAAEKAMPDEELFPLAREQMATFDHESHNRWCSLLGLLQVSPCFKKK